MQLASLACWRNMETIAAKVAELKARLAALRSLARELGVSETEAVEAYQHEVETLNLEARIEKFVPVLAEKRARDFVHEHQTDRLSDNGTPAVQAHDAKRPSGKG